MFAVIFEVCPQADQFDTYFGIARLLRPELEAIQGFLDNVRYRSLTRPGWLLSLSSWRDEKALVRWRTRANHHQAQERGRAAILRDYHLRVGQVTADTGLPAGQSLPEQRLDETEVGEATTLVLIDGVRPADWVAAAGSEAVAEALGLAPDAPGLVAWDVFDAVLSPGEIVLLLSFRDRAAADGFAARPLPDGTRRRQVRVVRDYGMFDRREAPQYYAEVPAPG